ncbi:MAG TPA: MSHA biogenesis protein MshK [Burkholderiales bacterium]|nr:MSHA biogenesis protein MshK [Burkholderiales bacterium]
MIYVCSFIFALFECPAQAENLPDPTRPPQEPAAAAASAASAAVPSSVPLLQSVLISPRHKVAIIDGKLVVLGGMYGTARVVKISESEVVLNEGGNLQTLKLFPGVEKKTPQIGGATDPTAKKMLPSKPSAVMKEGQ